jgi:hypothetical protein
VKVDALQKDASPSIGFEWFDVHRKLVSGAYARPVDDNGILKGGWVRYEGRTRMMKDADAKINAASVAKPAEGGDKAPTPPFDIAKFAGIFAAIGMAVGMIGTALAGILDSFKGFVWWQ